MRPGIIATIALTLCAAPGARAAAPNDARGLPEKTLTAALGRDLLLAARGAARLGIRYLKARQEKNDPHIWALPAPGSEYVREGWKTVKVVRPVYKTVVKTVPTRVQVGTKWVWVTETDPNDPYKAIGRKRVRRPVYKTVMKKRKIQVRDGKKTRVVEEKRAIYRKTDQIDDYWRWVEGVNALALYALLVSGEPPDSAAVKDAAAWLYEGTLDQHGLPDTTYELSLFILCFSRLDGKNYAAFTRKLLEKLVRGQIHTGKLSGMWGLYAVDFDRLRLFQEAEMKGVIIRDKLRALITRDKKLLPAARGVREKARIQAKIDRNQKRYDAVMAKLKKIRERILALSRLFSRGEHWGRVRKSERIGGDIHRYPGAFYDARITRRADITCTHLALLALRDAVRFGAIKKTSPFYRQEVLPALRRAARALQARQTEDGSWGYCVAEQHSRPPRPPRWKVKPQPKPNEPCMSMTAAGLAGLNAIAEITGWSAARRVFGKTLEKARAAVLRHLALYSRPGTKPPIPVCTQFGTLYYYFALATAMNDPALVRTAFAAIPDGVLCRLLFSQQNDGSWPLLPRFSFGSGTYTRSLQHRGWRWNKYENKFDHQLVNTCFAIVFLCEMGRPTVGALWHWSGKRHAADDERFEATCEVLARKAKAPIRWRSIAGDLPDGLAAFAPTLVMRGAADPTGRLTAVRRQFGRYLDDGGLLVAQVPYSGAAGFESALRRQLRKLYPDAAFKPLPESHPAFATFTGDRKPPPVEGAWRGDRLVAVFLPQRVPGRDGLSRNDVRNVTLGLLASRVGLDTLTPRSVVGPEEWNDVEHDVEAALARIKEEKVEVPPEKKPPEKKPGKEPKKEPPKKPEGKPPKPPEKTPPKKTVDDEIDELDKKLQQLLPGDDRKKPSKDAPG